LFSAPKKLVMKHRDDAVAVFEKLAASLRSVACACAQNEMFVAPRLACFRTLCSCLFVCARTVFMCARRICRGADHPLTQAALRKIQETKKHKLVA